MMRALAAIALALLIALPMEAAARDGARGGGRGGGGGSRLSFPRGGSWQRGHGKHGHGKHGGHHGHHKHHHYYGGSSLFFYGAFGPYWYPGWPYRPYYYGYSPYYFPYYYPYYGYYPYPPASVPYRVDDDDDRDYRAEAPPPAADEKPSYGLIRLDGVRDGAGVELDGRFWLTADDLDDRWLALPEGEHRIAVTVGDGPPMVRTIRIVPGRTHVLKFDGRAPT